MSSSNSSVIRKKKKPLSNTLLAGGTAGFVESSICHPLDTIKTRMQLKNDHIESVGKRLRHSLVEPTVMRVRHSLMEPALRSKYLFSELSTIAATGIRKPKHSLVEPANLIKLQRHSLVEPSSIQPARMASCGSSTTTNGLIDVTKSKSRSTITPDLYKAISSELGALSKDMKPSQSIEESSAANCWWNQSKQSRTKTFMVESANRPFQRKEKGTNMSSLKHDISSIGEFGNKNSIAWWNWHRNVSAALAGRRNFQKSAAWCQPMISLNVKSYGEKYGHRKHGTIVRNCRTNTDRKRPLGPIQTAQKVIRKEGFLSLYKGLSAVYVGIIPKMAIRFVSFESYKDVLELYTVFGDKSTNFAAGLLSGLTEAVLIVTPAEVCKIRMQSQHHSLLDPIEINTQKYGNVVQTAVIIVREEGYGALYKGVVPTMLRQGCNQAVNFTAYNSMKAYWLEQRPNSEYREFDLQNWKSPNSTQQLPGTISMLIGGLSGAMGPILNNPLDVVKTRLQKQNTTKTNGAPKYNGLFQACFEISKEEGAGALWKGITPRLMRIVPGQAITFTTYEAICRWL